MKDTLKEKIEYYNSLPTTDNVQCPTILDVFNIDICKKIVLNELKNNNSINYYYILNKIISQLKEDGRGIILQTWAHVIKYDPETLPYWEELAHSTYLHNIVTKYCTSRLTLLLSNLFIAFHDDNIKILLESHKTENILDYLTLTDNNSNNIPLFEYIIQTKFYYDHREKYYFVIMLNDNNENLRIYMNHIKKMILHNNLLEDFFDEIHRLGISKKYTMNNFYKNLDVPGEYKLGVIL